MPGPNIIFLHVDQMHYLAMSNCGNPYVHTPNLDRIAADGMTLAQTYSPMPVCCPARASWYTGRMSKETGVMINSYPLREDLPDLGQWLSKHTDYESVYAGKWHVTGRVLSDSFKVIHHGHGHGEVGDAATVRSAVAWLENRDPDRPFFLSVGLLNPHDCCFPVMAHGGPAKYGFAPKIEPELPPLPENFDPDYRKTAAPAQHRMTEQDWRYYIYTYYRMVEMVDAEIGRFYDAAMNSKYAENTVLIFTSDHGDGLGFHSRISKGFLLEEAARTPAIVVCRDRIRAGSRDDKRLFNTIDIAPTVCEYAGAPLLPGMTVARSWKPILEDRRVEWRDHVVSEADQPFPQLMIRDARFKTIFAPNGAQTYDLEEDPWERNPHPNGGPHQNVLQRHRKLFVEYLNRIEVFREPEDLAERMARAKQDRWSQHWYPQGNRYKAYNEWYDKVLAEGGS